MDRRQFCDTVARQLRCRWEAPAVRQELSDHIQDHMDVLLAGGMDGDQAEEAAVAWSWGTYTKHLQCLHYRTRCRLRALKRERHTHSPFHFCPCQAP